MAKENITIAITGTPGVGKTTFAKELSKKIPQSKVIEINDVVEQFKLYSSIDKFDSKIVKLKELETKMKEIIKENASSNLIIVGHLAPELKMKQDITVVLRLSLKELIKRLEARDYPKEKIRENIISESTDYCGLKASETCKETYEIETDPDKEEMTLYLVSKASGKPHEAPDVKEIDKLEELLDIVGDGNKYSL